MNKLITKHFFAALQTPSDNSNQSVDDDLVKPPAIPTISVKEEDSKLGLADLQQPKFEISISDKIRPVSGR